ncbi:MAG: RidA family protein [Defluviicoccus sp.]|nr:RidA family protein [Defluviicoccus sp.]MDE0384651.1 RidA family protein [Defluviicoccus sp.]
MAAARREIRLDNTMEPISHYTDAVLCGDFLYVSGAGPFDKDGVLIGEGDVVRQCEATCANIDRVLSAADMSPSDVVYFKVLMEEVYDGPRINPVRIDFHGDSYPGSTRVGVGHFALPGMLLEIECVAYKPRNGGPPRQEIRCEELFEPPSHYIDVVKCGDYAFVSGTGPIASDGRAVHFGDPEKQAFKTLENMEVMLDAAGMGFGDVCKVVCYLENVHDRPKIDAARRRFFGDSRPCSTLFGVRRLAIPGMNHEIEAIAYKPGDGASPRKELRVPRIHEPISHYTDAVQAGDFLFVSGQGPFDPGFALAGDTMTAQAEQVHDNLRRVMEEAGFGFGDVAKVTAYLDDCDERQELNAVRQRYFGRHRPASTLFGANRLAVHGMKLAIDAICYRPGAGGARS